MHPSRCVDLTATRGPRHRVWRTGCPEGASASGWRTYRRASAADRAGCCCGRMSYGQLLACVEFLYRLAHSRISIESDARTLPTDSRDGSSCCFAARLARGTRARGRVVTASRNQTKSRQTSRNREIVRSSSREFVGIGTAGEASVVDTQQEQGSGPQAGVILMGPTGLRPLGAPRHFATGERSHLT